MAREFKFALIDAFTTQPLGGNPCAVVFGAERLREEEFLAIAREMNQSETAFVLPSQTADLRARYFTPEREIPLAGHPTIATFHAVLETGQLTLSGARATFSLELNDGPIQVHVEKSPEGNLIRMVQRKPVFGESHDPSVVLPLFGLAREDLLPGATLQTVSTGTPQLMVPLRSHESLRKLRLDADGYRAYRAQSGFFSPHLFCLGGISPDAATFARHPGAPPDTAEDAFTGSATGGMAAYLWKYGLLQERQFIAEQGHWMNWPGRAFVEVTGPRDDIESVSVAGQAVTVVSGRLRLGP